MSTEPGRDRRAPATLTDALLGPPLATDAARPAVTHYDDATGERVELSWTTLANWAAKTANLLRDECDVEPGGRVGVLLPGHWQTLAVLLGAWWCGAQVVSDPSGADVVCCDARGLDRALDAGAGVVLALSLDAFGASVPGLPEGVLDYATEVRGHGDAFLPEPGSGPGTGGLAGSGPALDGVRGAELLAAARSAATEAGVGAGDRVLSVRDWSPRTGLLPVPLAVLAAGASLVHCRHPDPTALERRRAAERITHLLD